jgi:aspartokinase
MNVVMKFGGTSVADADAIGRLIAIVRRQIERQQAGNRADSKPPIVVVSALSKVTDGLLGAARLIESGDRESATSQMDDLVARHVAVALVSTM